VGAVGLGAVVSAVFLARRPSVVGLFEVDRIAAIVAGLGAGAFSFSRWIPLSVVFLMMAGFGMFMAAPAATRSCRPSSTTRSAGAS
jgi:hypothetical protein